MEWPHYLDMSNMDIHALLSTRQGTKLLGDPKQESGGPWELKNFKLQQWEYAKFAMTFEETWPT